MRKNSSIIVLFSVILLCLPFSCLWGKEYGAYKTEIREGEPRVTLWSFSLQTELAQGELTTASVFFKLTKPMDTSEKVFFHLVKPGQKDTVLNADFFPRYSTLLWDVNQVVQAGPFELAIPYNLEPGEYEVRAGLMDIIREESMVRYVREPYTNQEIKDFIIGKLTVTKTEVPERSATPEFDLVTFNNEQDINFWETLGATVTSSQFAGGEGKSTPAARVTILPGPGYPGVILQNFFTIKPAASDWVLYDTLEMDLFLPADKRGTSLMLQVTDNYGREYKSRVVMKPRELKKLTLSMVDLSGEVDLSSIMRMKLFAVNPKKEITFYISRLRLLARGMPTGKPAVTFVRMEAPESIKRGEAFQVQMTFKIDQPIFQKHKMFVHVYRENDIAGRVGVDTELNPPIRNWGLNTETTIRSSPLVISEDVPPGTYVIRSGLYLIARSPGKGYVKLADWDAYGGKQEVINIMQPVAPVDYIKQPYSNLDIQDWEVGTIKVE